MMPRRWREWSPSLTIQMLLVLSLAAAGFLLIWLATPYQSTESTARGATLKVTCSSCPCTLTVQSPCISGRRSMQFVIY